MSVLVYNHAVKRLTMRDRTGVTIGSWPANNNVDSSVGLPSLPNGVYAFVSTDTVASHHHKTGDTVNGKFGPLGDLRLNDFTFRGQGHQGVAVHSGRKHHIDGAGRSGVNHATNLCIRTTDEAMSFITASIRSDPLEKLIVEQSAVHRGFVNTSPHMRR